MQYPTQSSNKESQWEDYEAPFICWETSLLRHLLVLIEKKEGMPQAGFCPLQENSDFFPEFSSGPGKITQATQNQLKINWLLMVSITSPTTSSNS